LRCIKTKILGRAKRDQKGLGRARKAKDPRTSLIKAKKIPKSQAGFWGSLGIINRALKKSCGPQR
jgi:hypothetical protein